MFMWIIKIKIQKFIQFYIAQEAWKRGGIVWLKVDVKLPQRNLVS